MRILKNDDVCHLKLDLDGFEDIINLNQVLNGQIEEVRSLDPYASIDHSQKTGHNYIRIHLKGYDEAQKYLEVFYKAVPNIQAIFDQIKIAALRVQNNVDRKLG